ncbi:MAG: FAD-binding oxidoreductase [Beijerinckiaceae bacterium]
MPHTRALEEIRTALGQRGVVEGEDLAPFTQDIRGTYRGAALLLARPASTEEVAAVVRICAAHGLVIVPQGGNTGLCGGAIPRGARASIILSLSRMNRIISVDPERYTITAEAGCILQSIHDAAAEVDRTFAMDWGARGSATVGGGISTNAGGINVLRFGNTRDQVLGLEAVLPDGRIWNGLRALRKDSSGYDLKHLFIGAEGTLGIVTKAVLKLHPRPAHEQSMWAAVADLGRLMELFVLARSVASEGLTAFELVPGYTYEKALAQYPSLVRPVESRAEWYVIVRFSGQQPVSDKFEDFFARAFEAGLITDGALAQTIAQENNIWNLRDEIPPLKLIKGKMLKWDASVPIDRIVPFLAEAQKRAHAIREDLRVIAFGHVGDGNLHMSIFPEGGAPGNAAFDALCKRVVGEIDELVWSYGGSICAEHGVGVENFDRLPGQKPAIELEMMARIRDLFDPRGIFNPGKLFDAKRHTAPAAAE